MNPVILTANDPEPPIGSVMLGEGGAWQRASDGWYATGLIDSQEWDELFEYESTLTLVYRGPDPEPDAEPPYRMAEPPIGSVVLDRDGGMWQRLSLDWCLAGLDDTRGWNGLRAVGPVTLLYRGEA